MYINLTLKTSLFLAERNKLYKILYIMNKKNNRKPIHWVGSALDDIREFPDNIKRESITGASKMIDTQIRHTTDANGNVFADLGFAPQEAQQLKSASEQLKFLFIS